LDVVGDVWVDSAIYSGRGSIISGSTAEDKVFNVKAFNAKGDGVRLVDASIYSGSATLTSATASFTISDVGKVITMSNGVSSGVDLTTTIASVESANSLTLATNATNNVIDSQIVYGTDDTVAIQAAIDAVRYSSPRSGTVFIPEGIYIVNGAFNKANNSQIEVPTVSAPMELKIKGVGSMGWDTWLGSILYSTRNGTDGTYAVISGIYGGDPNQMTHVYLTLDNLLFKTVQNPKNSCLNFARISSVNANRISVDNIRNPAIVATHTDSYGYILPTGNNDNIPMIWSTIKSRGFYTGIKIGEHSTLNDSMFVRATYGIEFNNVLHMARVTYVSMEYCKIPIRVTGSSSTFVIDSADIEPGVGDYVYGPGTMLEDSGNYASGYIGYKLFGGANWVQVGGKGITTVNLLTGSVAAKGTASNYYMSNASADGVGSGAGLGLFQNNFTAIPSGTRLGTILFGGSRDTNGTVNNSGGIEMLAEENFDSTHGGSYMVLKTTSLASIARTERMRITAAGNVGIGTTASAYKLRVDGAVYGQLQAWAATTAPIIADGAIYFDSATNHFMGKVTGAWKVLDN
jgi:hypothetical protein